MIGARPDAPSVSRWLLPGIVVALLGGCGGDGESAIYSHDFSAGDGGWRTARTLLAPAEVPTFAEECWTSWLGLQACIVPVPVIRQRMVLESPWWLDPNHASPGEGHLALLAWVYLDGATGSSAANLTQLDLRNARLRISIRARGLDLAGGRLVFWMQTSMADGRYANYAYTRVPLDTLIDPDGDDLELVDLRLSADADAWTCLGSSATRTDTYGCLPVELALTRVDNDFGLIIIPVSDSPLPVDQPRGRLEIQSLALSR